MTSSIVCSQEKAPQATVDDTAALPTNRNSDGSRTNSAPTEKVPADPLSESQAAYVFIVCCLDDLLPRYKPGGWGVVIENVKRGVESFTRADREV